MELTLDDLEPKEAELQLSEHSGKVFHLSKITLRVQIWLNKTFGSENIRGIFAENKIEEISQIAYFLLKEKDVFPTIESFQDAIVNQADRVAMVRALLDVVGVSQPVLEKMARAQPDPNAPGLSQPTGA